MTPEENKQKKISDDKIKEKAEKKAKAAAKAEEKALKKALKKEKAKQDEAIGIEVKPKKIKPPRTKLDDLTQLARSDIRVSGLTMGPMEARYLVDAYYITQNDRIRSDAQVRSMGEEPAAVIQYLGAIAAITENTIKKALDDYTLNHPVGAWLRTITGIGPVTAAGLLAHLDVNKSPTAGGFWKFAGLSGDVWEKGQKRPWNAELKKLVCFKIGESFVKTQNKDDAFYGKLYRERKNKETALNESGGFAETAAKLLTEKNWDKSTPTYACMISGKLSPAHIHARARRYAVKMFLAHLHEVMYMTVLGKKPPNPYVIEFKGHVHKIEIPNPGAVRGWKDHVEIVDDLSDDVDS